MKILLLLSILFSTQVFAQKDVVPQFSTVEISNSSSGVIGPNTTTITGIGEDKQKAILNAFFAAESLLGVRAGIELFETVRVGVNTNVMTQPPFFDPKLECYIALSKGVELCQENVILKKKSLLNCDKLKC